MKGVADTDISKDGGMVLLHGERWAAYSDEPIGKGENIIVEAVSGLKVKVKRSISN
jgi:membrane-bound serine protease (ClpP class)